METLEYRTVDKSSWPRGEWDQEPDKRQWQDEDTGFPCLIVRGPIGSLCGYVGVPADHPWHGKGYSECVLGDGCETYTNDHYCNHEPSSILSVHGGLSFADKCSHGAEDTGICHLPGKGEPDNVWWFGFDCAHAYDLSPRLDLHCGDETYRNVAYVEAECWRLAAQLAEVRTP